MRKLLIGVISLGAILGVYLLYSRMSESPMIETGGDDAFTVPTGDANDAQIGDVGLGTVQKAYFTKIDQKTKKIEREFGFEKLLHQAGDIWEIEKPYMNVYRPNFKCYVTADKGQVQVETVASRTTPRDATFSSNVVIHIVPEGSSGVQESFVYLDDIIFLSDKSLISTAGPVRFVSDDAQMKGTGMELIYNAQAERLEYFRIADLESLRIKSTQAAVISTGASSARVPAAAGAQAGTSEPNQASVAGAPQQVEAPLPEAPPQVAGEFYKCIVSRNVLLEAPEQLILADEKLYLNDLFWSKASLDQSGREEAGAAGETQASAPAAEGQSPLAEAAVEPNVSSPAPAEPNEPNAPAQPPVFITVTCDGGLLIVPRDSTRTFDDNAQADPNAAGSRNRRAELLDADTQRTKFFAQTIDYNRMTGDVIAGGLSELMYYANGVPAGDANEPPVPVKITARDGAQYFKASNQAIFKDCLCRMPQTGLSERRDATFSAPQIAVDLPRERSMPLDLLASGPTELIFYAEDPNQPEEGQGPLPVKVTARKWARYWGAARQMLFEGECRSTMLQEDPNVLTEYVLLSEQLIVDLAQDANGPAAGPAADVKHLTATGGIVSLATTKTAKPGGAFAGTLQDPNSRGLLGGIQMKCYRFDYDAVEQVFLATGPGLINFNNSPAAEPNGLSKGFSLRQPCWAVLDKFDTLTYLIRENRIVADAGSRNMLIGYLSAVDGRPGEPIWAETPHVEALLYQAPQGQKELSTLAATRGIYYEDSNNRFRGSELFYDHKTGLVTVRGNDVVPCNYNGAPVDGISLDMNTGKVEANVVGPGTLQLNR
jgi:hypothetical protein